VVLNQKSSWQDYIDGQKRKSHEGLFLAIGKKNTKPSWLFFKKPHLKYAGAFMQLWGYRQTMIARLSVAH
jgi:hypothetical protein